MLEFLGGIPKPRFKSQIGFGDVDDSVKKGARQEYRLQQGLIVLVRMTVMIDNGNIGKVEHFQLPPLFVYKIASQISSPISSVLALPPKSGVPILNSAIRLAILKIEKPTENETTRRNKKPSTSKSLILGIR